MRPTKSQTWFTRFTKTTSRLAGRPISLLLAIGLVVGWLASGPLLGFSETWQLAINTSTTIITFLMVFLIQSTQNRDTEALQVKLDELIRVTRGAHVALLDLEEMEEDELDRIRAGYARLAQQARAERGAGRDDTGVPEVPSDIP
jgi:low affinity Fe/Cu permease